MLVREDASTEAVLIWAEIASVIHTSAPNRGLSWVLRFYRPGALPSQPLSAPVMGTGSVTRSSFLDSVASTEQS